MNDTPLARVLIVDDERAQVLALSRTLAAEGYATAGAGSASEALSLLRQGVVAASAFDVLVTDLLMPEMDGIALLRAARDIDADLVGVVMTGHGTIDTAVAAMKSGAHDYILKPFNLTGIMPVISRAVAVRGLRLMNATLLQRVSERTAELEAANRDLQVTNSDLEAFAHSVSHDLRDPLKTMAGLADLLLSEAPGGLSAQQREYIEHIRGSGQRLLELTSHLLRFARLGRQPLAKINVDVGALLQEVRAELLPSLGDRRVELRIERLPAVPADRALLRQVFVNLLSNAFKFTKNVPDARIEIAGEHEGDNVIYTVRDNGVGFDPSRAGSLFTMFRRLHAEQEFEGSGIGLAMVRRIIERHGGRISADAEPGRGARFEIRLPR
jgi:two-component system, sensor histidine kinase and response regulator